MNEFGISDFQIFNTANTTTKNFIGQLESLETRFKNLNQVFSNDDIIQGPIADDILENINKFNTNTTEDILFFQNITSFFNNVNEAYKKSDKDALSKLLQVLENSEFLNPGNLSGYRLDFINSIKDGAIETYKEYGVLPSLTLAQAVLETGWGKSKIGNNIFGIKAGSSWTGKTINCETGEQNPDGSRYTTNADFRDYDSISDSIKDHGKLLTNERYQPVINSSNYKEACVAVRECGYATSLNYSSDLISIIEDYGLDQWDPK